MPNYDLSSIGALTVASELAHIRANREPSQDGYNAAWLHGYASALADAAQQLEPQQELFDAITGYMGEQCDSAALYAVLHDKLAMSDQEMRSLGFELPQCAEPQPEARDRKTPGKGKQHERSNSLAVRRGAYPHRERLHDSRRVGGAQVRRYGLWALRPFGGA